MTVACDSAAAYVLGALPAGERSAFEEHLSTCADCRQTLADLAGIPGLLSRVSPADLDDPVPVPDTLVPGLLRAVRRTGRRRRLVVSTLAAAAVVIAVAGTLVVSRPDQAAPQTAMTAVVASPVRASVALVRHPWGTEITMDCTYREATEWSQPYVLVAVDRDGGVHEVATWSVGPGHEASVTGSVPLQPGQIDRVEIRTTSGTPLLRLRPQTA